jgi:enediyne biosynthesis protein E4
VDVLISVNNGAPLLLKNNAAQGNHWLGLRLIGTKANPDAVGARVSWECGSRKHSRMKVGGGSYMSAHDPRMVLGLGSSGQIDKLEIRWPLPSTRVDTFTNVAADRYISITEGKGIKA